MQQFYKKEKQVNCQRTDQFSPYLSHDDILFYQSTNMPHLFRYLALQKMTYNSYIRI